MRKLAAQQAAQAAQRVQNAIVVDSDNGNLLRRLGKRKYQSETVEKNWGSKAKELEALSELIRKLLKTYQQD
ncbi:MAG TPA: hypothetical protein VG347_06060 [Verrucomicrobiae bacterium]|nr:hypothetical protein [Verrucomicrobiae bacterium]